MCKHYEIEVYHYPEDVDYAQPCADDTPGAEFELVVFAHKNDTIGELVNVYSTRAEAEAAKKLLES